MWGQGGRSFWVVLFVLLSSVAGWAQGLGTISGTITDPSGAVVPGAQIRATQVGTGLTRSAISDNQGGYVLPSLQPANYTLRVEARGFRLYLRKGIILLADQSLTVNLQLQVGATSQAVTVQAPAVQVNTSTATLGEVVDEKRIVDLPLDGRNAATLTTLVAGVAPAPNDGWDQGPTKTFPGVVLVSTNGSQENAISYLLDGGNNLDEYTNVNQPFPFPDALQEFSVETSNYAARYGNNAGGVVNIITKSGTNQFHGDLFEFDRNAVFNARNFFAAERDQLKRNQFGGTIGGPIQHDRTFFFAGYQGTRIRNVTKTSNAFVPTSAETAGDFSAFLSKNNPNNPLGRAVQLLNPNTGQAIPGNIVNPSQFDPAAMNVIKGHFPAASGNGLVFFSNPVVQNFDEFLTRIDHSFAKSDRITFRYYFDRFNNPPIFNSANFLTYADGATIVSQNFLVHETHTFRANLLNDFRFSASRDAAGRGPAGDVPNVRNFGVSIPYQPAENAIYHIGVSGFFKFGGNPSARFTRNNFAWSDDVSWVKGRHTVGFGGSIERSRVDINNLAVEPGSFNFTGDFSGVGLVDFMFGKIKSFSQNNGEYTNDRNTFSGVYAQDDFRVNRRLTLNLGMRYEPFSPWDEIRGRREEFRLSDYEAGKVSARYPKAPPGLFFSGDPGIPKNGTTGSYNDFAPRAGFAYDVFGNGRTALRGGGGVFYDSRLNGNLDNYFSDVTPFSFALNLTPPPGPFSNPLIGVPNPFPTPFPPPAESAFPAPVTAFTYDPSTKYLVPVTYDWNLTLEHEFARGWLGRIAYAGSHSSHLDEFLELNPAIYIAGSSLSTDARRPLKPYGNVTEFVPAADSSYNSLQVTAEKRLGHAIPVTILANYTYSKSIDDLPTVGGTNVSSDTAMPYYLPGVHQFDRGPSDFDHTHRFVASYVWQLPSLAGSRRLMRSIFGNWEMTGIYTVQSGDALTVLAGKDVSETGIGKDRAVIVGAAYGAGACKNSAPCVNWLSPASFALPAPGTFGNVGKGSLRGPHLMDWDMGFIKDIPLTERYRLQFRAEFFNIFNWVNFNGPSSTYNSGGFGSIRGAGDPRIGQFALKFFF